MAGEKWNPSGRQVGWAGSPLGGQFHSSAGSGYPPAEEIETIENVKMLTYEGEEEEGDG